MFKFFLLLWLFLPLALEAHQLPLHQDIISLESLAGEKILSQNIDHHFLKLKDQFLTQKNQTYCGVASIVMVLNALNIEGPADPVYAPFRPFTQDNFFSIANTSAISLDVLAKEGMTLDQAASLLITLPVHSKALHADQLSLKAFRELLKNKKKNRYLIANFLRDTLQQERGGHFSPIGAYDKKYDRVLILDVARYKYPPVWVKVKDLWEAMNTMDSSSKKYRGLLLIEG